jgi:hypothetical protein
MKTRTLSPFPTPVYHRKSKASNLTLICIVAAFFPSLAHSAITYTVSYGINTTYAQYPGFGSLPSGLLIEGSFSYTEEPSIYSSGHQTVYNILSQTVSINGVAMIVEGGDDEFVPLHHTGADCRR